MDKPTYAVWCNHVDRRHFLGHASGTVEDIAAYYDDQKAYGLDVELVIVKPIPEGYAAKRANLQARKNDVEKELRLLNAQLTAPWSRP